MNLMSSFSISVLSNLNFLSLESSSAIFCKFFLFTEFNCCIFAALSKINFWKIFFRNFKSISRTTVLRVLIFNFLFWFGSRWLGELHIFINSCMMNMFPFFWAVMIWGTPCWSFHLETIILSWGWSWGNFIDVGDRYSRRNLFVTSLRRWWPIHYIKKWSPTSLSPSWR